MAKSKKASSSPAGNAFTSLLKKRFEENMERHQGISWSSVQSRLEKDAKKIKALQAMEETGGEPDVVGKDDKTGEFLFFDCAPESPSQRRSLCYDRKGWETRKEARPESNAVDEAKAMGIELLDEDQYRYLQTLGEFDLKTSSWLNTPAAIRSKGGAIFGDRRFDHVFIYHNGAQSYYAGRGFRGVLRV